MVVCGLGFVACNSFFVVFLFVGIVYRGCWVGVVGRLFVVWTMRVPDCTVLSLLSLLAKNSVFQNFGNILGAY